MEEAGRGCLEPLLKENGLQGISRHRRWRLPSVVQNPDVRSVDPLDI